MSIASTIDLSTSRASFTQAAVSSSDSSFFTSCGLSRARKITSLSTIDLSGSWKLMLCV